MSHDVQQREALEECIAHARRTHDGPIAICMGCDTCSMIDRAEAALTAQATLMTDRAWSIRFEWPENGAWTYWSGRDAEADPADAAIIRDRDDADLIARGLEGMYSATVTVVPWSNDL